MVSFVKELHRFFTLSKTMADDDALAYRRRITEEQPSLPSQAGRAYAKFERVMAYEQARRAVPAVKTERPRGRRTGEQYVTIFGLTRPEIDLDTLARAVFRMAIEAESQEGEQKGRHRESRDSTGKPGR